MASVGTENDRYILVSSHSQCEKSNTCSTLCVLAFRKARKHCEGMDGKSANVVMRHLSTEGRSQSQPEPKYVVASCLAVFIQKPSKFLHRIS